LRGLFYCACFGVFFHGILPGVAPSFLLHWWFRPGKQSIV
jgi:hypothetical protein